MGLYYEMVLNSPSMWDIRSIAIIYHADISTDFKIGIFFKIHLADVSIILVYPRVYYPIYNLLIT
jgi:hypothetical protein